MPIAIAFLLRSTASLYYHQNAGEHQRDLKLSGAAAFAFCSELF